jgi:hypothetical protein
VEEKSVSAAGPKPAQPSPLQLTPMRRLAKGASRFDPAASRHARHSWGHLAQCLNVTRLYFTHEQVSSKFLHGPRKGESVELLVKKLLSGWVAVDNITPLVVMKCAQQFWVVFGNRRLKAVKEFAARPGRQHPNALYGSRP